MAETKYQSTHTGLEIDEAIDKVGTLGNNITAIQKEIAKIQTSIESEAKQRLYADNSEAEARKKADEAETNARQNADNTLLTKLTNNYYTKRQIDALIDGSGGTGGGDASAMTADEVDEIFNEVINQ